MRPHVVPALALLSLAAAPCSAAAVKYMLLDDRNVISTDGAGSASAGTSAARATCRAIT